MTITVQITGWAPGLNKVGMTKAIQTHVGLGLKEAKACTDDVLAGSPVDLQIPDLHTATQLCSTLEGLKAHAKILHEPV